MTTPEPAEQRVTQFIDRRREPRESQPAAVKVKVSEAGDSVEFDAIMMDSSSNGLAIRHWRKDLGIGQSLRISLLASPHSVAQDFLAHVVWNWSVGPVVISGLEKVQPGVPVAARRRRGTFGIDTRRFIAEDREPTAGAVSRTRSWIFAAVAALLMAAGWFFKTRF